MRRSFIMELHHTAVSDVHVLNVDIDRKMIYTYEYIYYEYLHCNVTYA